MIIDIDNSKSVTHAVKVITKDWIDIDSAYLKIQSDNTVGLGNFWNITDEMICIISEKISCPSERFQNIFSKRLVGLKYQIMGYHCTRHNNKISFIENGILPLSKGTIKFSEKQDSEHAENILKYRFNKGTGPYFFLSYNSAKDPINHYCNFGAEILLGCNGKQLNSEISEAKPMIIHCSIPFSILPDHKYYIFCLLRAYFNFIDPIEETENLFSDYAIDLKNKTLSPKHINRIEEL